MWGDPESSDTQELSRRDDSWGKSPEIKTSIGTLDGTPFWEFIANARTLKYDLYLSATTDVEKATSQF